MGRVVTFGEIMLRLSPEGYDRLFQNDRMHAVFGGAEANVAVSLAGFGEHAVFVTKVPDLATGHGAIRTLKALDADVSKTVYGGSRLGIYYYEKGAGLRSSVCIYDRNGSAFQEAVPEDFDWDDIFDGADWFHFSGITPALGGNLPLICKEACLAAKSRGVMVSCDLNYRSKLWTESQAREVMTGLCKNVDVCIANEEDAARVFGIEAENSRVDKGVVNAGDYESVAAELFRRFAFKYIAFSLRTSHSASRNDWAGMLFNGKECYHSQKYYVDHIVDRVGSGDSFAAGVIYGIRKKWDGQKTVDFSVAASALKHSIEGDFNRITLDDVLKLLERNESGRIER